MRCGLLASIFLLVSAAHVFAQQAEVSGSLRDVNGRGLPGVSVALVDAAGQSRGQAVTDAQGRFQIGGLDAGLYAASFLLPGFEVVTRADITVAGTSVNLGEITLRVGTLAESVQVPRPLPPRRDTRPQCLHGQNETDSERQRRVEAFLAMHLIASLLQRVPISILGYPDWETLARSNAVSDLQNGAGPTAELARRIRWGEAEPLPGWDLTYARSRWYVRFALTDSRDPCGFSYDSNDLGGYGRVLPLR